VFWKDEAAFRAQLRRWPPERIALALDALIAAELDAKSGGLSPVAETLVGRALLQIATNLAAR
jgi:hypothetical protein